jgi:hypothetical protein
MGSHPVNLALRFFLELAAWGSMGYWGWTQHDGVLRVVLGIGLPVLAMALWGTFRIPGDPKDAPVAIPGWLRLILELAEFGLAVSLLYAAGREQWAIIFGAIIVLHYAASYDRVAWMLKQR